MNNLLVNYKEDILLLFKTNYQKLLNKNSEFLFSDVLVLTLNDLNLTSTKKEETDYLESWFNLIHHQIFLTPFLELPFTEMILHSHQSLQLVTMEGKKDFKLEKISAEDFQLALEVMAHRAHMDWNFKDPFASFNCTLLNKKFRATFIHHSTSSNEQSKAFFRAITHSQPKLELFHLPSTCEGLIKELIGEKKNILISGGTGSGKTTMLRSLIDFIPHDEHIVVLEDTYEILNAHPGQTSFLAQKEMQNKSLKDYCAYSLRMSPDRLIIGEMRSSEVIPFLLMMNTGHKGMMSSIHANSAVDALNRIALLFSLYSDRADLSFSLVTRLVCKNVDYVIHMEDKKILEIIRVIGSDGETPFYEKVFVSEK